MVLWYRYICWQRYQIDAKFGQNIIQKHQHRSIFKLYYNWCKLNHIIGVFRLEMSFGFFQIPNEIFRMWYLQIVLFLISICFFCTIACSIWEMMIGQHFTVSVNHRHNKWTYSMQCRHLSWHLIFFFLNLMQNAGIFAVGENYSKWSSARPNNHWFISIFFVRDCRQYGCANFTLCFCRGKFLLSHYELLKSIFPRLNSQFAFQLQHFSLQNAGNSFSSIISNQLGWENVLR